MARDILTDKGIGTLVAGSFSADLAQFWNNRIGQIDISNQSSEYRETSYAFNKCIESLLAIDSKESHELALRIEELHNGIVGLITQTIYRTGYTDGVRMIIQSLLD